VIAAFAFAMLAVFAGAARSPTFATDGTKYGGFGPEGPRMREQLWVLPGADPDVPLRATLFRPEDAQAALPMKGATTHLAVRRPLVVINHGTDVRTRLSVAMPVYYWMSRWFVDRGYAVLLPQRRGHGATGGLLAEGQDSCTEPEHYKSGLIAADDIEASINYMATQPFIDRSQIIVVGVSTGGWASLALASRNIPGLQAVINFSGGRGGHAHGVPSQVCGAKSLIAAAGRYGETAHVPTLWLYARNDSYFGPDLAMAMATAWRGSGGEAEMHILPSYSEDGHNLANDEAGWDLWGPYVDTFLKAHPPQAVVAHDDIAPGSDAVVTASDASLRQ
jgi:dienelactone hydrolase